MDNTSLPYVLLGAQLPPKATTVGAFPKTKEKCLGSYVLLLG